MMQNQQFIAEDGPERDPLDVAAENAARRFLAGDEMSSMDWEALQAKATAELREYDAEAFKWN